MEDMEDMEDLEAQDVIFSYTDPHRPGLREDLEAKWRIWRIWRIWRPRTSYSLIRILIGRDYERIWKPNGGYGGYGGSGGPGRHILLYGSSSAGITRGFGSQMEDMEDMEDLEAQDVIFSYTDPHRP